MAEIRTTLAGANTIKPPQFKRDQRRSYRSLISRMGFLWRRRKGLLGLVLALFLLSLAISKLHLAWLDWARWDMVITLISFGVLWAVFFGEADEDWEDALDKRLNVYFQIGGKTRMVCYEAHLPHEGDIRNWAQQIGRQMCDGEYLEFSPYLDLQELGVVIRDSESFKLYQAEIYLKRVPQKLQEQPEYKKEGNSCKFWCRGPDGLELEGWSAPEVHVPHRRTS